MYLGSAFLRFFSSLPFRRINNLRVLNASSSSIPTPLPTIPFCFESFSDFARRQKAAFKKKWNEPLPWHLWLGLLSQPADTPATASSRQDTLFHIRQSK